MNIVETGGEHTLTVRVQPCAIQLWRELLRQRLEVAGDHSWRTRGHVPYPGAADDDPVVLAGLLQCARATACPGQSVTMTGPFMTLGRMICAVADAACARYADAWREFGEASDLASGERLCAAIDVLSASMVALSALGRAQQKTRATRLLR